MRILAILIGAVGVLWGLVCFWDNRTSREDMWLAAAFVNICLILISSVLLIVTSHWIFVIGIVIPWLHALVVLIGHRKGQFLSATIFALLGTASVAYGVSSYSVLPQFSATTSAAAAVVGCALITLIVRAWIRW